ncbi:hypothetical protein N7462_008505 [Penicillium macrosclerotiorum]|uniref:uncharacterized protein n=1 Tax=Penicillium macrosclerotiorum TaxID=303699 RepID=UPI00254858CB|nr:uncharacterized protein N7462_008505 [Penicillium macrosclerotiorum]KAJ5675608.1 hypothetical protein N7462_008505 [Penicillium macrosclerotiorum]
MPQSVDTDTFHDSNSQHVRATSDVRGRNFNQSSTEDETSNSNHQAVLRQPAAKLCNRLVSYRDIRCKDTDSWAIEEGSVVIGIDPSLVRIRQDNRDADELRLRLGNFYVIGRMFSDMWAWCFEIAVDLPGNYQMRANEGIQVGFVPLCAVTLAANFSSFLQRCQRNRNRSYSGSLYPGNGLVVEPPQRDWSTVASRELSRVERLNLPSAVQFPKAVKMIYETFTSLDNPGTEYVPWDSSVQILLSQLSNDANRQSRTKRRNSWLGPKTLLTPFFGSPKQFPSHNQEPSTASSLTHHLGTSDSELNPPSDKEVASVSQKTPQRENSSRSLSYSLKRLISKSSGKTHRE